MKNQNELYPVYTHFKFWFGVLTLLRLSLMGLERYAAGLYAQLLGVVQKLPAPIPELPALLQRQDMLWTAWMWVWEHGWMVYFVLLLLPWLEGLRRPLGVVCDLAVDLARVLVSAARRTVGWVIRLRCREITLAGCQYVIVGYQDGFEQVADIRANRTWAKWREHPNEQVCLHSDENGIVNLEWPGGQYQRLEDRCPVSPRATLREHYPELRAVEYITLYDDFGR